MKRFDTAPEEQQQNPDQEQHSQRIETLDRPMCDGTRGEAWGRTRKKIEALGRNVSGMRPKMLLCKTFLGQTGEPFRLGREPHGTESARPTCLPCGPLPS